jgi:hypothetical protein
MLPTTGWDDDSSSGGATARAWTVMGRLRIKQHDLRARARLARRMASAHGGPAQMITTAMAARDFASRKAAGWRGGPSMLAILFTKPDSDAVKSLDANGKYFDIRTGDTWDLFFPGYYRSPDREAELKNGSSPVGSRDAQDWYFSPRDFMNLHQHVERESNGRYTYSGGTDLVLINTWLTDGPEDPVIDWTSTISGQLTDTRVGNRSLTLDQVIERVTNDLVKGLDNPNYGVEDVTNPVAPRQNHFTRGLLTQVIAGIVSALGAKALGA